MVARHGLVRCLVAIALCSIPAVAAINSSLIVDQPKRSEFVGDIELIGPRSQVTVRVPPAQATANTMTNGVAMSKAVMVGLTASGAIATSPVDISSGIVVVTGYNNAAGSQIVMNLKMVPGINAFFAPDNLDGFEPDASDDVASVLIRVTTADRNINTDGVQTFFNGSEDGDSCFTIDQEAPKLLAAYNDSGTLRLVFSESLGTGQSSDGNTTSLGTVGADDFQSSGVNAFGSSSPGPGAPFIVSKSYDDEGGTTIGVNVSGNASCGVGRFIRCHADDAGSPFSGGVPLNGIRDIVGNVAFQADDDGNSLTTGVVIEAGTPPIYRQWLNPGAGDYADPNSWAPFGVPGLNDTLRIDHTPSSVTVNTQGVLSSSRRLWTGGPVTLNLGGQPSAAVLRYTETDEPSLVVGYLNAGSLNCVNSSGGGAGVLRSEWTEVRTGGSITSGNQANFVTGKLLVEGAGATATAGFATFFTTGSDDATGGTPPDFTTVIRNGGAAICNWRWTTVGPCTIGPDGTFLCQGSDNRQRAEFYDGLTIEPFSGLAAQSLRVGEISGLAGVSILGEFSIATGSGLAISGDKTFTPDARLTITDYDGRQFPIGDSLFEANLDGTLTIEFDPAFSPALGTDFDLLSTVNGRFALHLLPGFPDDRVATIEYSFPASLGSQWVTLHIGTLGQILGIPDVPNSTPVQGSPVRADVGDLNGDGFVDLAVVIPDANANQPGSVLVLLNNGVDAGFVWQGFSRGIQITTGPDPTDVAIGNFDNDTADSGQSNLDLAVSCAGDDTVRIHVNDGTGLNFEASGTINVAAHPAEVDAAHFNGDTNIDLSVTCADADVIQIFVNDGVSATTAVAFSLNANVVAGDMPTDSDPVDLDNDKDLDISASNYVSGNVSFATNDGGGSFGATSQATTGDGATAVDSGDLDRDGDQDSAVANQNAGTVTILQNNGTGDLVPAGDIPVGTSPRSLTIVDLDGDNDLDIAVVVIPSGELQPRIQVIRNDTVVPGPLTFTLSTTVGGEQPVFVLTGDVNNDGREDLIAVREGDAASSLLAARWIPPGAGDENGRTFGEAPNGSVAVFLNYSAPSPACAGNANKDDVVDAKDLNIVLAQFGESMPPQTGANLNADFTVDYADLSLVLSTFGNACGN